MSAATKTSVMKAFLQNLRQHPVLFSIGCFLTFGLITLVSLVLGSLAGLNGQEIGRGAAGVVLVAVVPGGMAFVKYFVAWRVRHNVRLDTPTKRKIFLLVPLGAFFLLVSWLSYPRDFDGYVDLMLSPEDWRYDDRAQWAIVFFGCGTTSVVAGMVFSYLYDLTLSRISRWVSGA